MREKIIIAVLALVLVSGLFVVFTGQDNTDNDTAKNTVNVNEPAIDTEQNQNSTSSQEQATKVADTNTSGLGYVEYSEQLLADSSSSKRILFFHAPWCSVCNFYEGQIEEQGVPSDVTILKIDFDSEDDLKEKYNVTTQSTFVLLDNSGNIANSWPFARGLSSIQDLYSQI